MVESHSVSFHLCRLRQADVGRAERDASTAWLWGRYFEEVAAWAERRFAGTDARRVADEEDVAVSVFDKFFAKVSNGEFPRLADRDDARQILAQLTKHKVIDRMRRHRAVKRGGGEVRGDAAVADGFDGLIDSLGARRESARVLLEDLMAALPDDELNRIAVLWLEGNDWSEIAAEIGVSPKTLRNRVEVIERIWTRELNDELQQL